MTRKRLVLGLSALAVVAALLVIGFVPFYGGETVRQAASSSLGVFSLGVIVVGLAIVGLMMLVLKRCTDRPHPTVRQFFGEDGGTAAVEMLLALPIILMIVLVILQATHLWTANIVFHYSSYAATRSASSIISDNLELSGENRCLMFNDEAPETPMSLKFARIRRAAVMALIPISTPLTSGVEQRDPELSGEDLTAIVRRSFSAAGAEPQEWLNRMANQFRWADYFVEVAITQPHHWDYDTTHEIGAHCPYHYGQREWGSNDWVTYYYCPYIDGTFDYAPWERAKLYVEFPYELSIPYGGKILFELLDAGRLGQDDGGDWSEPAPGDGLDQFTGRFRYWTDSFLVPGSDREARVIWMARENEFIISG